MILYRFSMLFFAIVAIAVSEPTRYSYEVVEVVDEVESEIRHKSCPACPVCSVCPVCQVCDSPKPVRPDDGFGVFTPAFSSIGGNIVDVSTRGKEVWVIKSDDSIHRFKNGQWQQMPGAAVRVGASPDGWAWVINRGDHIYRFNVNSQTWDEIPGALVQVGAVSKDSALGVNRQTGIWLWNGNWNQQPGLATWASIGQNDERWVIGLESTIWRWNHQISNWQQQPGGAVQVDVHSPNRIVVVNAANQVYAWLPEQKNWKLLEGKVAKRATVGDGVLITLGLDGLLTAERY